MARRRPTVEIDESLIEAARAVALRSGVPEQELYERALRDVLVRDFAALMDETAEYQAANGVSIGDDESLALAVDEVRAARATSAVTPRNFFGDQPITKLGRAASP